MKKRSLGLVGLLSMLFLVLAAGPALAYSPNGPTVQSSTSVVSVGGTLGVGGSGFTPLETISIVAHSTPVNLPSVQADASGDFTDTITLPTSLAAGSHEIVATGLSSGDVATFAFTIVSSTVPAAVPAAAPTSSSGSSGGLAFTGTNAVLLSSVGAGALAVGGFLVLASHKRRRHLSV